MRAAEKAFEAFKCERLLQVQINRVRSMSSSVSPVVCEYVAAYIRMHPNLSGFLKMLPDADLPRVMKAWYYGREQAIAMSGSKAAITKATSK